MRRASYLQAIEFYTEYCPRDAEQGIPADDILRRFIIFLFDVSDSKFDADVARQHRNNAPSVKKH